MMFPLLGKSDLEKDLPKKWCWLIPSPRSSASVNLEFVLEFRVSLELQVLHWGCIFFLVISSSLKPHFCYKDFLLLLLIAPEENAIMSYPKAEDGLF